MRFRVLRIGRIMLRLCVLCDSSLLGNEDYRRWVIAVDSVGSHENHAFNLGLSQKHSVEDIFVDLRQRIGG